MQTEKLAEHVFVIHGSVNCGVLTDGDNAVLFDCPEMPPETDLWEALNAIGVKRVARIFLTQSRRAFAGGLCAFSETETAVFTSDAEAALLRGATSIWANSNHQFHRYHCLPDQFLILESFESIQTVRDKDRLTFGQFTIEPIFCGAFSAGDMGYLVTCASGRFFFGGAFVQANGCLNDLFSLQQAMPEMMGYHGHLGGLANWLAMADRLEALPIDRIVPAVGEIVQDPSVCINAARKKLIEYANLYAQSSAVRYYFPKQFKSGFEQYIGFEKPKRSGRCVPLPAGVQRIGETTSFLIRSKDSKRCVLIDCGDPAVLDVLRRMRKDGEIERIDFCWVTHYHDDHLNAMGQLSFEFGCPIRSTIAVAQVCNNPKAWFLPATSDVTTKMEVVPNGTILRWAEYSLTALHFPGQTLHHSGLIVQYDAFKIFFCGDSFAPLGLDDYCSGNRNLLGEGRGYALCLSILQEQRFDAIINNHQSRPFVLDDAYIKDLVDGLAQKEQAVRCLTRKDANLALDDAWIRAWPFSQTVSAGSRFTLEVHITGHGRQSVDLQLILPDGLCCDDSKATVCTQTNTSGSVFVRDSALPPDQSVSFSLRSAVDCTGVKAVKINCTVDGVFAGSMAVAWVEIL